MTRRRPHTWWTGEAFGGALIDEPTIRFALGHVHGAGDPRLMLWRAAAALDANEPDKVTLCAMAKLHVTDSRFHVADRAPQPSAATAICGSTAWRRSSAISGAPIPEGTNEIMRVGSAARRGRRAAATETRRSHDVGRIPRVGQHGLAHGREPGQCRVWRAASTRFRPLAKPPPQRASTSRDWPRGGAGRRRGDHHAAQRHAGEECVMARSCRRRQGALFIDSRRSPSTTPAPCTPTPGRTRFRTTRRPSPAA